MAASPATPNAVAPMTLGDSRPSSLRRTFTVWAVGSAMFGAGTAMAYPTLIVAVGDVAHPTWRGAAVGVYRL